MVGLPSTSSAKDRRVIFDFIAFYPVPHATIKNICRHHFQNVFQVWRFHATDPMATLVQATIISLLENLQKRTLLHLTVSPQLSEQNLQNMSQITSPLCSKPPVLLPCTYRRSQSPCNSPPNPRQSAWRAPCLSPCPPTLKHIRPLLKS